MKIKRYITMFWGVTCTTIAFILFGIGLLITTVGDCVGGYLCDIGARIIK
jgi:hypothetical protein